MSSFFTEKQQKEGGGSRSSINLSASSPVPSSSDNGHVNVVKVVGNGVVVGATLGGAAIMGEVGKIGGGVGLSSSLTSSSSSSSAVSSSLFNKKLFTNFGGIGGAVGGSGGSGGRNRARRGGSALGGGGVGKRRRDDSIAIFGRRGAAAVSKVAAGVQRVPAASRAGSSALLSSTTRGAAHVARPQLHLRRQSQQQQQQQQQQLPPRFVSWQNYVNLLNLVDGLKHQLPNFGYDLFTPFITRLLFESVDTTSSFEHLYAIWSSANNSATSSSSLPSSVASGARFVSRDDDQMMEDYCGGYDDYDDCDATNVSENGKNGDDEDNDDDDDDNDDDDDYPAPYHRQQLQRRRSHRHRHRSFLPTQSVELAAVSWTDSLQYRDWNHLYKTALLPLLKLFCTNYRDEFRPVGKSFLTQTFTPNRLAKRWDTLVAQAAATVGVFAVGTEWNSGVVGGGDNTSSLPSSLNGGVGVFGSGLAAMTSLTEEVGEEEEDDNDVEGTTTTATTNRSVGGGAIGELMNTDGRQQQRGGGGGIGGGAGSVGGAQACTALLVKFFNELRASFVAAGSAVGNNGSHNDAIASLVGILAPSAVMDSSSVMAAASNGCCPCCMFAPLLVVRASRLDDQPTLGGSGGGGAVGMGRTQQQTMQQFLRNYPGHMISFDAANIACGTMPPDRFVQHFTLKHLLHRPTDRLVHELAKTAYVSSLTFYERLLAVQFLLAVLIEWSWSRQRLTHTLLQGAGCSYESLPPVVVVIHRRLYDILSRVPTVPLLSLSRERKFLYHVLS